MNALLQRCMNAIALSAAMAATAVATPAFADPPKETQAPWGTAKALAVDYVPAKVVFDIRTGVEGRLENLLDRVSMLNNFYASDPFEAKIVIVLHGEAIPYFAKANLKRHESLMKRAVSLTHGEVVEFRLCRAAARARYGLEPADFHGFVAVVPMADAEIVRLQQEGYAYMF